MTIKSKIRNFKFICWLRDVRDIGECKKILWRVIDRDYDERESLRNLIIIASNSLYWERSKNEQDKNNDS